MKRNDGPGAAAEKPFIEHLEELRIVLIKSAVVLLLFTFASFVFAPQIIKLLVWPLERIVNANGGAVNGEGVLRTLRPMGGFMVGLKASFLAGITLSLPCILYFLGRFIIPGLTQKERGVIFPAFSFGVVLFLAGASFCYFLVLPFALDFFWKYSAKLGIRNDWIIENYISFAVQFLVAFGLVFELPCVALALVKVGVLTSKMMRKGRRYAIVAIFVIAAAVTPTPDMVTQILVALPMVLLYELCVWIAAWMERKDPRAEDRTADIGMKDAQG